MIYAGVCREAVQATSAVTLARARAAVRWLRRMNGWFAAHVTLTTILAGWAFTLALPLNTFGNSTSYARFRDIYPDETYWAVGFGAAALVGVAGCWAARPHGKPSRWHGLIRVLSAALLGINHGMIALLMGSANPASTATATFAPIMILSYVLAIVEADRVQ